MGSGVDMTNGRVAGGRGRAAATMRNRALAQQCRKSG
jgi:hypothetical protein